MNNSFKERRARLMERFRGRINRQGALSVLHKQNQEKIKITAPWREELKKDAGIYTLLAISAVFTFTLGIILGLAPYKDGNSIIFHTDILHVFFALLLGVSFVAVTEGAMVMAKNKFHEREEANAWQAGSMIVMMVISGISIIGTGVAGGMVLASVIGFLSDFQQIPDWAQGWVVKIIPTLLALYTFCLIAYKAFSQQEQDRRLVAGMRHASQMDYEANRDLAQIEAEEMLNDLEIDQLLEAVESGRLSPARAREARRLGKSLFDLEREDGKDYNNDHQIGDSALNIPQIVQRTDAVDTPRYRPVPRPAPPLAPNPNGADSSVTNPQTRQG